MGCISAVVFDMDGLMIDSEPAWDDAMLEVFAELGSDFKLEYAHETQGLRLDEAVRHCWDRAPWTSGASHEEAAALVLKAVARRLSANAQPMPGLEQALALFEAKKVRLALASSSPLELIQAALHGLGLENRFEVVCSAESEAYGKPHPAVYLAAAGKLGVEPTACLALEDTVTGALAAKAARMKCIAVPDLRGKSDALRYMSRFAFTDAVLRSLEDVDEALWRRLNA